MNLTNFEISKKLAELGFGINSNFSWIEEGGFKRRQLSPLNKYSGEIN